MEEMALSNIMNAEAEKIRYALAHGDMEQIIRTNESAVDIMEKINVMQMILKEKLSVASKFEPAQIPPCPPMPSPKPKTCCVFDVTKGHCWEAGTTLPFSNHTKCENGVVNVQHKNNHAIMLPSGKSYTIGINLKMAKPRPVAAHMLIELRNKSGIVYSETYRNGCRDAFFRMNLLYQWNTPRGSGENFLIIRLQEPDALKVMTGRVL